MKKYRYKSRKLRNVKNFKDLTQKVNKGNVVVIMQDNNENENEYTYTYKYTYSYFYTYK